MEALNTEYLTVKRPKRIHSILRSLFHGRFFVNSKRCMRCFNGRGLKFTVDIRTNTGDARLFNILDTVSFANERQ